MGNTLRDLKDNYFLNLVLMTHFEYVGRFSCRSVKFGLITMKFAERDYSFQIEKLSS